MKVLLKKLDMISEATLSELKRIPMPPDQWSVDDTILYVNPSRKDLDRIMVGLESELRGLIWENKLYVWNSYLAHHDDVSAFLSGRTAVGELFLFSTSEEVHADEWDMDEHWADGFAAPLYIGCRDRRDLDHPMVKRAIG
jgi:hypothetical protein